MDRHHTSSFTRGIKAYQTVGSDDASLEFEGDQETLSIGTNGSYSWQAGDVVEMYDVYLTPGVYTFDLDITSGSADLDFGLFGSTDGTYYKNKEAFLARSANIGYTIPESFSIAVTTADYYGLCVWANDGNSSTYTIDIHDPDPGTWEGDNSSYWGDANNWSFGTLPDAATDVTIPDGTLFDCMLYYGSASCNSLTVNSGAVLNINGHALSLMDMSIDGSIGMLHDNSIINIYGNVEWNAGSTLNFSSNNASINVYGDWNFNEGANVNPGLGNVDFRGTSTKYIRCFSDNCSFYKLRNYKTGGAALGLSATSTEQLEVFMLTYLNAGTTFISYSSHGMLMKGSFNYYGTFDFNTGTVTFDDTYIRQFSTGSGTFNDVTFSSTGGSHMINGDMIVTGDLTIEQGYFSPDTNTVFVAGDWTNNVGNGGFISGTGRVIFNGGNYHQYCSNETFNELEINKPLGGAFRMDGTNVECAAYDWTAGAVDVLTGSFTANDLIDNGIFGSFYSNPGGIINLHQPTGFADLNGDLILTGGGEINIYGSGSSWIPYAANASITMSGGIIDFKSTSLRIHDALTLTTNITGGTIRTIGNFENYRTDFNLSAGTLEMYSSSDATLYQDDPSNYLNNVVINKLNDDGLTFALTPDKRDADNSIKNSKANIVNLTSDILVNNNLTINSGSLTLNGYELTVLGDCDIYGQLNMTNVADILNVGDAAYDNLAFRNGSLGNFTAGVVNAASWVWVDGGGLLSATTGNTINFNGPSVAGIEVDETGSVFGNINIVSVIPFRLFSTGGYTIEVDGDFDLQAGNTMDFANNSMIVHGSFTDDPTSFMYIYNGPAAKGNGNSLSANEKTESQNSEIAIENPEDEGIKGTKGGAFELDNAFTLNGLMDVGDGNVLHHDYFNIASTGTLTIDGGSYICDYNLASGWSNINGIINMSDGLLEYTNASVNIAGNTNISGGIIRVGKSFRAEISGAFQPTGGTFEVIGNTSGNYMTVNGGNHLHDFLFNRTNSYLIYPASTGDLEIRGNIEINSGILNSNSNDISIRGNWINNAGASGFVPSTGTVTFTGADHTQIVSTSEHFYNVTVDKASSALFLDSYGTIDIENDFTINTGNYYPHENTVSVSGNVAINNGGSFNLVANGMLLLGDGSILNVNNGGELSITGNPSFYSTIGHISSGYYSFNINTGGTIGAEYAFFEYMDNNGVDVTVAGVVNPTKAFNNCYFGVSAPGWGTKLMINNDQDLTISGANFSQSSGTSRNAWKYSGSTGSLTFIGALGDFAGPEYEQDPNDAIFWDAMDITIDLTAMLEGPFNGVDMNTDYYNAGLIPLGQPYNVSPWNYPGTESVGNIPLGVTDWVLIELRDATIASSANNASIVGTRAAFILEDGSIVDIDGSSPITFNISYNNGIYTVVRHINHLGIISNYKLTRIGGVYTYDFSSSAYQAYGGLDAQVQLSFSPVTWGMMAGDGDGNGEIETPDIINIWNVQAAGWGYKTGDFNMDGQVNNQDKNDFWVPNMDSGTQVPN